MLRIGIHLGDVIEESEGDLMGDGVNIAAHLFDDRADLAAELAERSLALNSEWDSTYWVLIAAYTQLDRLSEARAATTKLLAISPEATVAIYRKALPIRNTDSLEMVLGALQLAGLPEGA